MKKKNFYKELAYFLGLASIALGNAFMTKGDFGMSVIAAPAYIVYLKLSQSITWISFGLCEIMLQAIIIILLMIVLKRFRIRYLVSFATAFIYSAFLDIFMLLLSLFNANDIWIRIMCYVIGVLLCANGVALMFHTYIPQEAYDMFVRELARVKKYNINVVKTIYDISSLIISIALSFICFGWLNFVGIKIGSVIIAFINGFIIGIYSKLYEKRFNFTYGWLSLSTRLENYEKESESIEETKENNI